MSARPIVTLSGVTKSFGSFQALHETDFALGEGEFVTLLGPSGCGKTTTLRLIGGFELPTTGRIEVEGQDVTRNPPYRRPVNTVFQDYALFPHMSVAENVAYGLTVKAQRLPRAEITRQVGEVLEMVGLAHAGEKRPGALSGGQKQRVAMARAIIRKPRVLLLDEPLSALDVKLRGSMQVELKRLHRELGITFLMVTHDQTEALALSDRVVVMEAGRIRQIGSPGELYDAPETPYVADFIGATNLMPARYEGREGEVEVLKLAGGQILRRVARGGGFLPGSEVLVGIRPEHLVPGQAGGNGVAGRVIDTLFHGDSIRLEFLPEGADRPAFAQLHRGSGMAADALMAGQEIRFGVAPEAVMLFPAEAA